jgi:rhodanese-related sulfurtransferase
MVIHVEPRRSAIHRPPPSVDVDGLWRIACSVTPPTILDIRDEEGFRQGHLEGSLSAPESNTTALMRKVQEAEQVVLVCKDGRLSATVARMMGVCGFPGVAYLKGGLDAWKLGEKPLLETTRSGDKRRAHEPFDPERGGPVSEALIRLSPRVFIAGLLLSAAVLAILAWALAGGGP